jgi:hypothetical protein
MAISYPITLPNSSFATIEVTSKAVVGMGVSPYTGTQQVYAHQGNWWQGTFSLPSLPRESASDWYGALVSLNGMRGTFTLGGLVVPGLHSNKDRLPLGNYAGSPVVQGGSQEGLELQTTGWNASVTCMRRGDQFQVGTRLYMVTQNAVSDGSGQALLQIWPRLRESPANATPLILNNPKLTARLATNEYTWDANNSRLFGLSFEWTEAI